MSIEVEEGYMGNNYFYYEGNIVSSELICKTKQEAIWQIDKWLEQAEENANNELEPSVWLGNVFVDKAGMFHLVHIGVEQGIPDRYMKLMGKTLSERSKR